jgi:hypothetical protein
LIGATFKPVEVMRSRSTMTKKAKCWISSVGIYLSHFISVVSDFCISLRRSSALFLFDIAFESL